MKAIINNLKGREQLLGTEKLRYAAFYWEELSGEVTFKQLPELSEGDNHTKTWG